MLRAAVVAWGLCACVPLAGAQGAAPAAPMFRSSVDLVRVSATARDAKGRFVPGLTRWDFQVLDDGVPRLIEEFHPEDGGISLTVLLDASGSMEAGLAVARETAGHLLAALGREDDETGFFAFDTEMHEVAPYGTHRATVPASMAQVQPFGATSLYDAIAEAARRAATRNGNRRAVVVLTDGIDTSSALTPSEVSGIASAIDVPVYVVAVVPAIDDPWSNRGVVSEGQSTLRGSLRDLAEWTGGETFVASSEAARQDAARRVVDELRHQYLIAFEARETPGWHRLEVRTHRRTVTVRARSGYFAGQSRPAGN